MSVDSVFSRAQGVVADINQRLISSHQIANRITQFPWVKTGEEYVSYLTKLPQDQRIPFLYHHIVRTNTLAVAQKILGAKDPSYRNYVVLHSAISQATQRGECGEMSVETSMKCSEFSASFMVVLQGRSSHAFVILADSETDKIIEKCKNKKDSIFRLFELINPNSIIVDSFLQLTFCLKDLDSKGSDFSKYVKLYQCEKIQTYHGFDKNSKYPPVLLNQAEEIAGLVKKELKLSGSSLFQEKFLTDILKESCGQLNDRKLTPSSSSWKPSLNQKYGPVIFCICKSDELEDFRSKLSAEGIVYECNKVSGKDEFCLYLKNPYPEKFKPS